MAVLLLRPKEKLATSVQYMASAGIDTIGVGLIEIESLPDNIAQFKSVLAKMSVLQKHATCCIFVSTHAADMVIRSSITWPKDVAVYAVGPSTALALNDLDCEIIVPNMANSEGLLNLPSLQHMQGKTVFLIKGEGGRELLPTALTARGASVIEVNLYRRHRCAPMIHTREWQTEEIHAIVATSGEIMQIAWDTFDRNWLKSLPWVVVSRRLVEFAAKLGIQNVIQSAGASDTQLKDAINHLLER
jgi:uroporphyrinogen-III synthase